MEKKFLYEAPVLQECLTRLDNINADTKPQWGKMTAAQMMAHCTEILEVSNGTKELKNTPFLARLFKGYIRKMVVNEKPYPKSTQTHPQYRQTSQKEFEAERNRLIQAINLFSDLFKTDASSTRHPLFGPMSMEEKGWSMYKHLDHHLSQFGV